jgi:hypothetical protein
VRNPLPDVGGACPEAPGASLHLLDRAEADAALEHRKAVDDLVLNGLGLEGYAGDEARSNVTAGEEAFVVRSQLLGAGAKLLLILRRPSPLGHSQLLLQESK